MSDLFLKYPRIFVMLFAAGWAGVTADIVCFLLHDNLHLINYIIAAMTSAGFWTALIGKRITDITQSCTYLRSAILGSIATMLAIFFAGFIVDIEIRIENIFNSSISFGQAIKFLFIDDLQGNLGAGIFYLVFLGWYLIPVGALGAVVLRGLRSLFEPPQLARDYCGDDRDNLYADDKIIQ